MPLRDADADSYLAACPGAGKTHEVVDRYLSLVAKQRRRGIALLSFSNSAVDEVRDRCGSQTNALAAPNFVGTFDSFIHRFITTPHFSSNGTRPSYFESWEAIDGTEIRLRHPNHKLGFDLEWFDFEDNGGCSLDTNRPHGGMYQGHRTLASRLGSDLCREASRRWRRLVDSGIVSCSAARTIASGLLGQPATRQKIGQRLRGRFVEVIVDEMQDCGPEELEILRLCQEVGLPILLVADMDQSIYEFRNAVPRDVADFTSHLAQLPPLMVNRRSTPAICSINTSLRHGRTIETAKDATSNQPIELLVGGTPAAVRSAFLARLAAIGIDRSACAVVAHQLDDALAVSGQSTQEVTTKHKTAQVALGISVLVDPLSTPRERRAAQRQVASAILGFLGISDDSDIDLLLDQAGINRHWFGRLMATTVSNLKEPLRFGREDFTAGLKKLLVSVDWPGDLEMQSGITTPHTSSWRQVEQLVSTPGDTLRGSTIHRVKGQEFEATLVVLPEKPRRDADGLTALDHWEQDLPSEQRRVLYVGVSRPSEFLALGVPAPLRDQVVRILGSTDVLYQESML